MKKIAILAMGAAVALTSCNKEESQVEVAGSNVVSFFAHDIRTRVTGTSFDIDDVISVQAFKDGEAFDTADYKYAGNSNEFVSDDPIAYQSDSAFELSYQAVYPATANFASTFTHSIAVDQSGKESYEASDLLVATTEATSSLKPELKFLHRMSRVNIALTVNRDGVESTQDVVSSLKVNAATEAACDITADSYTASGEVVEITPAGADLKYIVLVAPQEIAANGFAVATIGGETFTMENVEATLASGYVYELEWTIDLTTGTQEVEIISSIDDWTGGIWGSDDGDDQPTVDEVKTMTFEAGTFDSKGKFSSCVVDGATFDVSNVYSYNNCFATADGSFLYNRTEMIGLSKIVVDYSSSSELTISACDGVNSATEVISGVENEGKMEYTFPADTKFFKIENATGSYNNANNIVISYTSLGETLESTIVAPVTIVAADWGLANTENVETKTLQGYTFSFTGTGTNPAKYYESGNGSIRYYTNDVMTIASADGSNISKIVFDTDGGATMTTTVGTFDAGSKTWTGSASSIEFTATATTKIESLAISAE